MGELLWEEILLIRDVLAIVVHLLFGLIIWMASAVPLMFREMVINTRKQANGNSDGPNYRAVQVLSVLFKIAAVVLVIYGIAVTLFSG